MNLSIKFLSIFVTDLCLEWTDGSSNHISLKELRQLCPCAGCGGEKDALGNVYKFPQKKLEPSAFEIKSYETVGLYGIRFFWKDGHHDGIYPLQRLHSLGFKNEE